MMSHRVSCESKTEYCSVLSYLRFCYFSSVTNLLTLLFLPHLTLKEFRAFELLRSGLDRSKYLLVKEAKIIAMTCTHAALKRHDLVELGFKVGFSSSKLDSLFNLYIL